MRRTGYKKIKEGQSPLLVVVKKPFSAFSPGTVFCFCVTGEKIGLSYIQKVTCNCAENVTTKIQYILIETLNRNFTRTCACIVARWWGGGAPPRGEGWGFGRNAGHGVLCAPIGAEKVEIETVRRFACAAADVQQEKAGKGEFAFEQPFSAWAKEKRLRRQA